MFRSRAPALDVVAVRAHPVRSCPPFWLVSSLPVRPHRRPTELFSGASAAAFSSSTASPSATWPSQPVRLNSSSAPAVSSEEQKETKKDSRPAAKVGAVSRDGTTPRFYADVKVVKTGENKYEVLLDGRSVRTPKENLLTIPSEGLAHAVAAEWLSQTSKLRPHLMPLMGLCTSALDQVPEYRQLHIGSLLQFLQTDTVCIRTTQPELAKIQKQELDPIVRWFQDTFKVGLRLCQPFADPYARSHEFASSSQLSSHEQPENTITRMQWYLHSLDDWSLCGLQLLSQSTKSVILPLAVMLNRLGGDEALRLSRLEEIFQLTKWQSIEAAHDLDEADLSVRVLSGSTFLRLLDNTHKLPKI